VKLGPDTRILVTGASGFIGRDLVAYLLERGIGVRALVRAPERLLGVGGDRLEIAVGDLRDPAALGRAVTGTAAVAHLAALKSDEPESEAVNVGGARALAEACRRAGITRVVNVSTQSVKIRRQGPYARTKLEAERVLHASGLAVTTLRPSVVYGPDVTGVFARMLHYIVHAPVVPVMGDGQWRSRPIHVRDVSRAIVACLAHDRTVGAVYDLGGPDEVTFDEIVDAIAREVGVRPRKLHVPVPVALTAARILSRLTPRPPVTVSNVLGSTQPTDCDITTATRDLGFIPLPLAEGLPRAIRGEPYPAEGEPRLVRVAVVGLGKMGLFHSTILGTLPGVRVVAAVDQDPALGRTARSLGLKARVLPSLQAVLDGEPVDTVFICTPTHTHAELVEACLARGLPVFVEKPLAERLERARALAAQAAAAGVVNAVGYLMAFNPVFERAHALLEAGALGRIQRYTARVAHGEVFGPKRGWLFDPARSGGGVVMNPTAHLLFLLQRWFGPPHRIVAETRRLYSTAVEDEATATLEYPSGLTGRLEASWSVPGKPILELAIAVTGEGGTLRATATELVVELTGPAAGLPAGRSVVHASDLPLEGVYDLAPDAGGAAYFLQDRAFIEAVRTGGQTRTGFAQAVEAEQVIDAIYRAAAHGAPVEL